MIKGLEDTGNRKVTEYLLDMLKSNSQTENTEMGYSCTCTAKSTRRRNKKRKKKEKERGNKHGGKTAQSQNPSKSKVTLFAVVCGVVLLLLVCIVYSTMKKESTTFLLLTPQEQPKASAIVQWSPKVYNSTNCNQPVGHDLPTLYDIFVGREDDIKKIMRKAMNVNIFNINGAPGFGKSTVAIHAGYKLLEDCKVVTC